MARVTCKASVRFKGFTRGLIRILVGVQRVAERTQMKEIVITSANDGRHSQRPRSRHYTNEALDVRSRNFASGAARTTFVRRLRRELGLGSMSSMKITASPARTSTYRSGRVLAMSERCVIIDDESTPRLAIVSIHASIDRCV